MELYLYGGGAFGSGRCESSFIYILILFLYTKFHKKITRTKQAIYAIGGGRGRATLFEGIEISKDKISCWVNLKVLKQTFER